MRPPARSACGADFVAGAARAMTRVMAGGDARSLDVCTVLAYLEADAPRVSCPAHCEVTAGAP